MQLTLAPNKELRELYGRGRKPETQQSHNYWGNEDWNSNEWPDEHGDWDGQDESHHDSYLGQSNNSSKPKCKPKGWHGPGKGSQGGQPFGGKPPGKAKPHVLRRKNPVATYVAEDGSVWEADDPSLPDEDTQTEERADDDQEAYLGKRGQAAGSREPRARPKVQFALSKPRQAPGKFQLRPGEGDESVG